MGETIKAFERRKRTRWFEKYAPDHLSGIDIGCGEDCLNATFRRWDLVDGDATHMAGVPDGVFHTVYCSHILEHLQNYGVALKNWWRILKPGGNLIILVPHRDLYERVPEPPSNWNSDHKWFWLPDSSDHPKTVNFRAALESELLPNGRIVSFEVLKEGWYSVPVNQHAPGEYSIEAIIRKVK